MQEKHYIENIALNRGRGCVLALPTATTSAAIPDSKVHAANMGPTWVLSAPDGPQVGPMNLAIWDGIGLVLPEHSVNRKAF